MPRLNATRTLLKLRWQTRLQDYVTAIAWSPKGHYLAASSAAGEVYLWHSSNQQLLLQDRDRAAISCLSFSQDGQFLAAAGQRGAVKIWSLPQITTQPIEIPVSPSAWIDHLAWSPVTNQFAFNVGRAVHIWAADTQTVAVGLDFEKSSVLGLAWHPQGQSLAVCGHTGTKVWNAQHWPETPYLLKVPGASLQAAWSRDGRYLAAGNFDRTLSVLELGKPPPWLMQGFPGKVRQLAWSEPITRAGSPYLAAACLEGITVWERDATGNNWTSRVLQAHQGFVQAIAFQPGTLLLASAAQEGQLYLWQDAKFVVQSLQGVSHGFSCLAWHPQGHCLAAGGDRGEILVWSRPKARRGFGEPSRILKES